MSEKHPLERRYPKIREAPGVGENLDAYLQRLKKLFLEPRGHKNREWEVTLINFIESHVLVSHDKAKRYFKSQLQAGVLPQEDERMSIEEEADNRAIDAMDAQSESIQNWLDYLFKNERSIKLWSDAIRYIAFTNVLKLAEFVPSKGEFEERRGDKSTLDNFPELNEEAVAAVLSALQAHVEQKALPEEDDLGLAARLRLDESNKNAFTSLSFGALYGKALKLLHQKETGIDYSITSGAWLKIPAGSPSKALTSKLRGFGTNWCIADTETAGEYLFNGDIFMYRTPRTEGKRPVVPRIGIHVVEDEVVEIRGIGRRQNIEGHVFEALEDFKVKHPEIRGWDKYKMRLECARMLGKVENKIADNEELSRDELLFLYELSDTEHGYVRRQFQTFGSGASTRLLELRKQRKNILTEDLSVLFKCKSGEIARKKTDLARPGIKAYVGKTFPSIFRTIPPHVRTIFTELVAESIGVPVGKMEITIGGKSVAELRKELSTFSVNGQPFYIDQYAEAALRQLIPQKSEERIRLLIVSPLQLGLLRDARIDEISKKAQAMGLKLCPAEVAAHLRLKLHDQAIDETLIVLPDPMSGRKSSAPTSALCISNSEELGVWG